ncbi:hypothetical protein [Tabrizicola sp. BL-A-41-H6]|uniref:hypothetical protein n=1 Tax=Tabrizicola sp. BL-A-41-H6 TaxID=3421107 RepID=UPI003D66682D
MTQKSDVANLIALTALVLDQRLQQLRLAAAARDRSRRQIAALDLPPTDHDLPLPIAGQVSLAYERWADLRRTELNALIARQTVEWMAARSAASLAFGRAEALRGLAARQAREKPRAP